MKERDNCNVASDIRQCFVVRGILALAWQFHQAEKHEVRESIIRYAAGTAPAAEVPPLPEPPQQGLVAWGLENIDELRHFVEKIASGVESPHNNVAHSQQD